MWLLTFLDFFNIYVIARDTLTTPDIFQVLSNNITIFSSFLSSMGVIISATVGTGLWLRKQVMKQNEELERRTKEALEKTKHETQLSVEANKQQIHEVKTSLCDQIQYSSSKIQQRLDDHKEQMTDIKNVIEKIDDKLDINQISISRNAARIDSQEMRINSLENSVYGRFTFKTNNSNNFIDQNSNISSKSPNKNNDK